MTRPPVRSKRDMYRRLAAGEFGNTNPSWYDLESWPASPERFTYPLWGIRSTIAAGGFYRLDVPTADVEETILDNCPNSFNLSAMVDPYLVFRGEVMDDVGGLRLFGVFGNREVKWREAMKLYGMENRGLVAKGILDALLWPGDREDLRELLESYPDHVIEFSALDRAVGTFPNRNTVIWEVRIANGEYERWV